MDEPLLPPEDRDQEKFRISSQQLCSICGVCYSIQEQENFDQNAASDDVFNRVISSTEDSDKCRIDSQDFHVNTGTSNLQNGDTDAEFVRVGLKKSGSRLFYSDLESSDEDQNSVIEVGTATSVRPDEVVVNVICSANPLGRKLGKKCRTAPALLSMHRLMVGQGKAPDMVSYFPSIVVQASIGLFVYLLVGIFIYLWKREEFSGNSTYALIDALYFCIVTMCTIGYGDITPVTPSAKMFSCLFVLVGFGFIDFLLSAMVAYALDRQEMLLLSTVDTTAKSYLVNTEKGRMRTRTKVALALSVVFACVGAGTVVMHHQEELGWLDSFYLACMSVTTVGYGDHAFKSTHGRLFAAIWLLVSTIAVARAFLCLAEAHIDRRHRLIAKWVLKRKLTVGDLVAADLNNDGFISKSEYVIYKLKEMGKIKEKDILAICNQFNQIQCGNSGKITLSHILDDDS